MKICYALLLHHKHYQFEWLFNALHNCDDYFMIHVDSKAADETQRGITRLLAGKANVCLVPRLHGAWCGFGFCKVLLRCIQVSLDRFPDWSYLVNLSGQCYPLKSRDERIAALSSNPELNYISVTHRSDHSSAMQTELQRRLDHYFVTIGGRVRCSRIPRRAAGAANIQYHGSDWFMVTRRFCSWIMTDPRLKPLLSFLRFSYCPSEFLMQNLVMHSEFRDTLAPNYLREIVWHSGSSHPELLTIRRKDHLLNSPAHFARKFDADVDEEILHTLAARVGAAPAHRRLC